MKDTSLNKDTDDADLLGDVGVSGKDAFIMDAWIVLKSLIGQVEGPEDWSEQHDHYLYGTPKK